MAASVEISESNTVSETVTDGVVNLAFSPSTDGPNLFPLTSHTITGGNNSYEKWVRVHLIDKGGSTKIENLRVWMTGVWDADDDLKTNARTSGYSSASFATPTTTTSTVATQTMPTTEPATANLGIGGSLSGTLTTNDTYSDYLVIQVQTDATSDDTFYNLVLHMRYDEE